ncbi:MAG: hypothetical protein JW928_09775 [Candidatus Aureabacteria bacterium]|nr:hypothetical protein [Candidatus Auribacterota bacterium]
MDWYTYFNHMEKKKAIQDSLYLKHEKRISVKRLGELLIDWGIIDRIQMKKALEVQKSLARTRKQDEAILFGEILVELGLAKDKDITMALATQYHLPYFPLKSYVINPEAVQMVPGEVAKKHLLIPLDKFDNCLTVAMSNPLNSKAIDEIKALTRCSIQLLISTSSEIKNAISLFYSN